MSSRRNLPSIRSTRQRAIAQRTREKALAFQARVHSSQQSQMARRARFTAWWRQAFRTPALEDRRLMSGAANWCMAILSLIGLSRKRLDHARSLALKWVGSKSSRVSATSSKRTRRFRGVYHESLEGRALLAADLYDLYVGDLSGYVIENDQGGSGLDNGDTVTWKGFDLASSADDVTGLQFGTRAFTSVQAAINTVPTFSASKSVAIGPATFTENVAISDKNLQLTGAVNATTVAGQFSIIGTTSTKPVVVVDGLKFTTSPFGVETKQADLTLKNSVVTSGSSIAISSLDSNLTIDSTDVGGSASIGLQVAGGQANITKTAIGGHVTGIVVNSNATVTIQRSRLDGNSKAMIASPGAGLVNASGNYWGSTNPNTIDSLIDGTVDFTPFLSSSADANGTAPGFQGDFSTVHVTSLGSQAPSAMPEPRVQEGVAFASGANPKVIVHQGVYDEVNQVSKNGVTITSALKELNAPETAPVLTLNSGTKNALMTVTASGVTIEGLDFLVNQPHATAGINLPANGVSYDNLTVRDNTFRITGVADANGATGFVGFGTASTAIAARGEGVPKVSVDIQNNRILPEMSGSTVTNIFDRAVYLRLGQGTVANNEIWGDSHDLAAQFVRGVINVNNNQFKGIGGKDVKGAQVDFTEVEFAGEVNVFNNSFTPYLGTSPSGSQHVRSLMVKNNTSSSNVNIHDNAFTVSQVGILVGNSINTVIKDNVFTPALGDSSFTDIQVSNKVPTSGSPAPVNMEVTIQGNDFRDGNVPGGIGIEFLNHNATGATFGPITIGGAGALANTFHRELAQFISLDAEDNANSTSSARPYYNQYGATVMKPFSYDLDASQNLYEIDGAAERPADAAAVSLTKMFALEDKIYHALDNGALGTVTLVAGNQYVTPISGSIQRGIDAADPNSTVHVQGAHTYDETVVINKNGITLDGDDLAGSAPVVTRSGGTHQSLITIDANNVTVRDMHVTLNQDASAAPVGISAVNTKFDGLSLIDNKIDSVGNATTNWANRPPAGLNVYAAGIVLYGPGGPSLYEHVTLQGNDVNVLTSGTSFYRRAVWLSEVNADVLNNKLAGAANDLIFQFASGGPSLIKGNEFKGLHQFDAAGVVIGDPNANSPVTIQNNLFQSTDTAAVRLPVGLHINRNVQGSTSPVLIEGNTFKNEALGVRLGKAGGVTVTGNTFTPADNMTSYPAIGGGYIHVQIDSSHQTTPDLLPIDIDTKIYDNQFNSATGSTGTAIRIDNNSPTMTFSGLTIGGNALQKNDYSTLSPNDKAIVVTGGQAVITESIGGNLISPVVISGGSVTIADSTFVGNGSGTAVSVTGGNVNISGSAISGYQTGVNLSSSATGSSIGTTNFDGAQDNLVDLLVSSPGTTLTAGNKFGGDSLYIDNQSTNNFDLAALGYSATNFEGYNPNVVSDAYRIEDKLRHKVDVGNSANGLVRIVANNLFVTTPGTGVSDETIQNAISAAAAGDTVNVEAGTFNENLSIGKSVKVVGAVNGDGTAATNLVAATSANLVQLSGTSFGGDDTVSIRNLNLSGNGGLSSAGVYVDGSVELGNLSVVNGTVSGFGLHGIGIFGDSVDGDSVDNVTLDKLSFSSNGSQGTGGSADIQFFQYNNNAALSNLTLVGSRNESLLQGAQSGIQFRGVGDSNGVGTKAMGNVSLSNVDISGKYRTQMLGIQRYPTVNNLSLNNVALGGSSSEITGSFGASLRLDAVGAGSISTPATLDLNNTLFRGLASTSAQRHEIEIAPDNNYTFLRVDGTDTSWVVGSATVAASALSLTQAYAVEDRILHYVDKQHPTHGTYKGFVDIQAGQAFITDDVNSGLVGDGSIQRGIDIVAIGGQVNVEAGTFNENLSIGKSVKVVGAVNGDGTAATNLVAATSANLVQLSGTSFGGDDTVSISNLNLSGNGGLSSAGVYVDGSVELGNLSVVNGTVSGFGLHGIGIFGDSVDGDSVDNVTLDKLSFSSNGSQGTGGSADIQFFQYNNNAALSNLTLVGSRNESLLQGAQSGIQFRGVGDSNGVGGKAMGNVSLSNVDISGKYRTQMLGIQRYPTVNNLSLNNVALGGSSSEITGSFGASLRLDAVGAGSISTPATLDLNNTLFRGLASTSAQRHEIEIAPDNNYTFLRVDGTDTSWVVGSATVAASALSLTQAYAVEDRILHYVDKQHPTHGTYKGFVDIQAGQAFITDDVNSGLVGDGSIQRGIDIVAIGGQVNVEAGTFNEDVAINRSVKVIGAGPTNAGTTISGPIGGAGSTVAIQASNVELAGFIITRDGNDASTWNNPGLNSAGISIQGLTVTGALIHDNLITGNRSGVDINNSGSHTLRNNVITQNHTGMILRNATDNLSVTENAINDNRTVGVLFLEASGGTNSPPQQAVGSTFFNNSISGNWYGQVVDRQAGGSVPTPGTNVKNFSGNWFGSNAPVVTTNPSGEPAYSVLIPTYANGTATPPASAAANIAGAGSANIDLTSYLDSGLDTDVEYGFQGDFSKLHVVATGAQAGSTGRITEGVTLLDASSPTGGTLIVHAGSYADQLNTTSKPVNVVLGPDGKAQVSVQGNLTLGSDDKLTATIGGLNASSGYGNILVTGTVALGGAQLDLSRTFATFPASQFTLIDNDGNADQVSGTFAGLSEGAIVIVNNIPMSISYVGGDGNDVVLTVVTPTEVWVNDTWVETDNTSGSATPGIQAGDTVSGAPSDNGSVTGKIFGFNAFSTIQEGINAVQGGGTVNVLVGTYGESLIVDKSVSLVGANAAVAGNGARGSESVVSVVSATGPAISVSASDVSIRGFTIDGNDLSVRGVQVNEVDDVVIENNIITQVIRAAQYNGVVGVGNTGGLVRNNKIESLSGTSETYGVVAFDASYVSVVGNVMNGLDVGIFEQYMYQPNGASNASNLVENNTITASLLGYGTNERGTASATTVVRGNTFNLTTAVDSIGVQLFNIYKTGGIDLQNNTITGAEIGIYAHIDGGSVSITGGSITGGEIGVLVTNYQPDYANAATADGSLSIAGTTVSGQTDAGIYVNDAAQSTAALSLSLGANVVVTGTSTSSGLRLSGPKASVAGNTLSNTSFSGQKFYVELLDGAMNDERIVATSAKFNGVTAPTSLAQNFSIEDRIRHATDDSNVGLVVVNSGSLYVTTPGTGAANETIQNAIDAAVDGETINVQSGNYIEDLNINKQVSLLGPNAGNSALTGVRSPEATIYPINDNQFNSVVVAINASNVRFDGFTVMVDRTDASGGIAASSSSIADISNLTASNFNNLRVLNNLIISTGLNTGDFDLDPVSPLAASAMGIAVIGLGSTGVNTVTIQGNRVEATTEASDPAGVSAFTRGIYLANVQGSIGGASLSQGNSAVGFAQDLLVQFAGGATTIRNNRFTNAGVDITEPAASAPVTIQQNTFAPGVFIQSPVNYPSQSLLIRNAGSTVNVVNNTFDDFHKGIVVEGGRANITGNTFTNVASPFGSDQAGLGLSAIEVQSAGSAIVQGNTFGAGINTGLDVNGGVARVQGNTFTTDLIGALVRNAGRADLGQASGGSELATGLGTSTGGNNFTSYVTTATPTEGAIVVLKNNAPNNLPGSQGLFNDTPAVGNLWNSSVAIEDVIYHDADDSSVGFVAIAATVGNVRVTTGAVLEGGQITVAGDITSPGTGSSFDLQITWGDGTTTIETVTASMISSGSFAFSHTVVDDNPTGSPIDVYFVSVKVVGGANVPVAPAMVFVSNVVPTFSAVAPSVATVNENSSVSLTGTINDPGLGDTFTLSINWGDGTITSHALTPAMRSPGGGIDLSTLGLTHVYLDDATPVSSSDIYTITLTVTDDDGGIATAATTVSVQNLVPVAVNDGPIDVTEDTPKVISVLDNDSDPAGSKDPLVITSVTSGAHGTVTTNGSTVTYSPNANYVGSDTFTYTINDGDGGTATATVTVNVLNAPDAPIANDDAVLASRNAQVTFNALANDSDPDGGALTVTQINGVDITVPAVITLANGTLTVTSNTSFSFSPNSGFSGTESFQYTVSSPGGTDTATVTINVSGGNSAPVAKNDNVSVDEDSSVSGNVLVDNGNGADSDPDNDLLTTVQLTNPLHGVATMLADGSFTYTPSADYAGPDSFKYRLLDGYGSAVVGTVFINVAPKNDAPTINSFNFTLNENSTAGAPVGTVVGSDIDSASLTYSISGPDAAMFEMTPGGELKVAAGVTSGQLNFEIKPTYTFDVIVSDGDKTATNQIKVQLQDLAEAGPTVKSIRVGSTAWSNDFRDFVDGGTGGSALGYQIPKGTTQETTLPWININQIIVEFSTDVGSSLSLADFSLSVIAGNRADGTTATVPSILSVTKSGNFATLTLSQSVEPSTIDLTILSAGVFDAGGNRLDGDWVNGSTAAQSGDGVSGTDFSFRFHVLPGDLNGDRKVDSTDTNQISGAQRFIGQSGYSEFRDVNGDGRQNGTDRTRVLERENANLP